jgi:hypothetical protein
MPTLIEQRPDGEIITVTGCSGSGKTIWAMRAVAPAARLLVWDSHLQWSSHGCRGLKTIAELARACSTREPAHLAYTGPLDAFDAFCRVALCWVKLARATVVIEELAEVTTPGKAPPGWGELVRWIRKLGGSLVVLTQRPQESDKTSLNNSMRIVVHACSGRTDARYMAAVIGVDQAAIESLNYDRKEHIERRANRTTRRGFTRLPSRAA